MIELEEALRHVLRRVSPLAAESVDLGEALGRVLAEDVTSDVDSPPHDKSLVDGYAVRTADFVDGQARLTMIGELVAGAVPMVPVRPGTTIRIMTGAPLPAGADAAVMFERAELADEGALAPKVWIREPRLAPGQNILRRGASLHAGDVVLHPGRVLRPIELGLLAEVGRTQLQVIRKPRVAVLSTGNELVPAEVRPGPAQIRNSNGPMLVACAQRAGAMVRELGLAGDEPEALRRAIGAGLESTDLLLISGGVSVGVLDLVPGVLAELGVEEVFHRVRIRPGKPVWFGVKPAEPAPCLVFALPGNPASSFVGFELLAAPALARLAGRQPLVPRVRARLLVTQHQHGQRASFLPARVCAGADGLTVEPLPWQGSADLRGLSSANALAHFAPGERTYARGEEVEVHLLDLDALFATSR